MGMHLEEKAGTTLIPERAAELVGGRLLRVSNIGKPPGHESDVECVQRRVVGSGTALNLGWGCAAFPEPSAGRWVGHIKPRRPRCSIQTTHATSMLSQPLRMSPAMPPFTSCFLHVRVASCLTPGS